MIEVKNVYKNYGPVEALKGVSFDLGKGHVIGLLGPNGAGKSTIMKIMTGFLPPTQGQVKIADIDIWENPVPAKQKIGYLPENPPLYESMRVYDYLKFCADLRLDHSSAERISFVVDRLGLAEVVHKRILHLSKGFKQRVGIAQAMVHNPDVLILDEPTIGLDPVQMIEIRDLILELKKDHTIFISTHILTEVEKTCDQVIIINKGQIIARESIGHLSKWKNNKRVYFTVSTKPSQDQFDLLFRKFGERVKVNGNEVSFEVKDDLENSKLSQSMIEIFGGISSMRVDDSSLEEIFVQMTSEQANETR
ncbi:MAG: MFS transporter [Bdellovibrionaceae bacterium]|nr:MFS transporter [Pseudobdellovibrionaceae bacterium]|tara:strand:- start:22183 stop:23103 length:921 start_codon:yes stop_codon:yes gene_type:complete